MGNGYNGLGGTSTANQELITTPSGWTNIAFYKFSFYNDQACNVKINGSGSIPLRAGQGFESGIEDAKIKSFVIVESGISFNWIGAY
jgi:hypothetical protein